MLYELRRLSARLGADPLLVQAAGGNTSLKQDGVMWIKASGTWLKDAEAKPIFVPLDLKQLSAALLRDDPACEACTDFVRQDLNAQGLRPSIETSVHGLMPQAVVLHVHCVNTIAWAIQPDAKQLLQPLLAGLQWAFVPYARPGLQLSRAIRGAIKPNTSVLILQNHGLVVAADTVDAAHDLLLQVVSRLERKAKDWPRADIDALRELSKKGPYRLPDDPATHGFAIDHSICRLAAVNVYYPDHAVFLGVSLPADPASNAPALALPGKGVLVHGTAKPSFEPMLRCLSDVFARLDRDTHLKPLTELEIDALLNWDAEKYRQTIKV